MFRFEKLSVWQKAIEYADRISEDTRSFPSDERFGLTSQLRRSAVSISSNIAEGSSRPSNIEFSRFVEIGYGSLMETVFQSYVANRQQFLQEAAFREIDPRAEQLAQMMSGLRSHLAGEKSC